MGFFFALKFIAKKIPLQTFNLENFLWNSRKKKKSNKNSVACLKLAQKIILKKKKKRNESQINCKMKNLMMCFSSEKNNVVCFLFSSSLIFLSASNKQNWVPGVCAHQKRKAQDFRWNWRKTAQLVFALFLNAN